MMALIKSIFLTPQTGMSKMKPQFPFSAYSLMIFFAAIFLLFSCNNTGKAKQQTTNDSIVKIALPPPAPLNAVELNRIKNACERWYDTSLLARGFNGSMLVAKNGNIVFERYHGTGHLPGKDIIDSNTSLHIASTSKTFTAMAVLKLKQEGKLSLDDEFSKYFPSFNYPGVTIRCLLNHRSGLPNYIYFMENLGWDKTKMVTNEDVLNYLVTRKSELTNIASPCMHFSYCNTNYALLALLIEKISGEKYADYVKLNFFIPLQMKNTFVFTLADTSRVNPSYDWREGLMPFGFLDAVYGDKNIYTTVRDLLAWDRALSSGKLFSPQTLEEAYAPYSNEKPGTRNYGLGWRMNIFPDGKKIIYHNGWWHGSNCSFIRLLKDSATIILIGNKFNRAIYHAKILCNLFGDYYNAEDEDETENSRSADSTVVSKKDNIILPQEPGKAIPALTKQELKKKRKRIRK
jgi:CubicO group peptidase (beta-lactamase class C family)